MIDFDHVLERIGAFKKYQLLHYITLGLAGIPVGMHALANVFLVGDPDFWCADSVAMPTGAPESAMVYPANITRHSPEYTDWNQCKKPVYVHDVSDNGNSTSGGGVFKKEQCSAWYYDTEVYGDTTTKEWDLVCGRAWLKAMAQSIYMFGFLVGAIGFGSLSDRIGRKLTWTIGTILLIISGVTAAFVPSYWIHVFVRFVSGVTSGGAFTCAFVLEMEIIGVEKRMIPGIFYQGWFAMGYMLLAVIAHFVRDYFTLQLIISLLPILSLPNYWLISESPRWLISQNRFSEAEVVIKRAAKMNNVEFPQDLILTSKSATIDAKPANNYTFFDLLRTPNLRRRSINLFFNWFVNSMVYYGLSLSAKDLAGTPYVNLFISGVAEFAGFILCILTVDRFGRRVPLAVLLVGGGLACLVTVFVPKDLWILETTFAMLGKMGISGSFALIYVFSAELFPTVVRTIGVGAGSMSARIGSLVAPFIADLGKLVWAPLPILIFGTSAVTAGTLSFLLPETLHKGLPETMDDGENFGEDETLTMCGIVIKKPRKVGTTNGFKHQEDPLMNQHIKV